MCRFTAQALWLFAPCLSFVFAHGRRLGWPELGSAPQRREGAQRGRRWGHSLIVFMGSDRCVLSSASPIEVGLLCAPSRLCGVISAGSLSRSPIHAVPGRTRRWRRTAAPLLRSMPGGNSNVSFTTHRSCRAAVAQLCVSQNENPQTTPTLSTPLTMKLPKD